MAAPEAMPMMIPTPGESDGGLVFPSPGFLQEAHAPGHTKDRGGNKKEAGDQTAENGLRIAKDFPERGEHGGKTAGFLGGRIACLLRQQQQDANREDDSKQARVNPELAPGQAASQPQH